jgi:hypothetical protein
VKVKTSEQLQRERQEKQKLKIKQYTEVTDVAMNMVYFHSILCYSPSSPLSLSSSFFPLFFLSLLHLSSFLLTFYCQFKDNVMDENALAATKKVLEMNTEYYTLWNYRRKILEKWAGEKYILSLPFPFSLFPFPFSPFVFPFSIPHSSPRTPVEMETHYKDEMAFTADVIKYIFPSFLSFYKK